VWCAREEKLMSVQIREEELRERLLKDNVEFRRLVAEHQDYADKLEGLTNKHFLSAEEQVQEKLLKKKKLILKDQMYSMVQKARKQMKSGSS
jgi:uncharacterized protein YdcH (DUF465 family)